MRAALVVVAVVVVGSLAGGAGSAGWQTPDWNVTLIGGDKLSARDINARGQVVGDQEGGPARYARATLWEDGKTIDLGTLRRGRYSYAWRINDRGEVAGWSHVLSVRPQPRQQANTHAFIWRDGQMTDLGTLGGSRSQATDINNEGEIVGTVRMKDGRDRAFLWRNDVMMDLGVLGGPQSTAVAINNRGQVIGDWGSRARWHGFLWARGRMKDLRSLGGGAASAHAINDRGQIVGASKTASGDRHAFLWQSGKMRDLGTLGGSWSSADAINTSGVVVGWSETRSGEIHGFRWQSGEMEDLGVKLHDQLPVLLITDDGLITGTRHAGARAGFDHSRAFVIRRGRIEDLPGRFRDSWVDAANEHGQIVGGSWALDRAVLWQRRP